MIRRTTTRTLPPSRLLPLRRLALATAAALALAVPAAVLASVPAAAQSGDTLIRLNQLESQVRELNGRIEEMNFFILQMQEELRRQKEDNEFRFQDLEQSGSLAPGDEPMDGLDERDTASVAPSTAPPAAPSAAPPAGGSGPGAPPADLGTLSVPGDAAPGALDLSPEMAGDEVLVAAIEAASGDEALLALGTDFAASGDHARAAEVLDVHARRYPEAATAPAAALALGRSLLAQDRPEEAAEVLLDGHERFGDAAEAPDMLVGVGQAMAGLGNRDIACATFDEVDRLYPLAGGATAGALRDARAAATC